MRWATSEEIELQAEIERLQQRMAELERNRDLLENNLKSFVAHAARGAEPPSVDQAPIAAILVGDESSELLHLYAPGLPPGSYDLYLEPSESSPPSVALADVAAERERQKNVEGWTPDHDDEHECGEMAQAAACYIAHNAANLPKSIVANYWPWNLEWWKPKDHRRNLVRAGALILAEIERLDRAAPTKGEHHELCDTNDLNAEGIVKPCNCISRVFETWRDKTAAAIANEQTPDSSSVECGACDNPGEACSNQHGICSRVGGRPHETTDNRARCKHGYLKGDGFEAFTICPSCRTESEDASR